jgi:hypothetical protein
MYNNKKVTLIFDISSDQASNLFQFREFSRNKAFFPDCDFGYIIHSDYFNRDKTYNKVDPTAPPWKRQELLTNVKVERQIPFDTRNYEQVLYDLTNFKTDIAILIGQGLFHDGQFTNINYRTQLSKIYKKGIRIYTIHTGGEFKTRTIFKEFAGSTCGQYFNLTLRNLVPYLIKAITLDKSQLPGYIETLPENKELHKNIQCLVEDFPYQGKSETRHINFLQICRSSKISSIKKRANIQGSRIFLPTAIKEPHPSIYLVSKDYETIMTGSRTMENWSNPKYIKYVDPGRDVTVNNCEVMYAL